MCEVISIHYEASLVVLERGVDCILYCVDINGDTNVQTGHVMVSIGFNVLLYNLLLYYIL